VDFREDILITAHHLLPGNTTIATTAGDQSHFHGRTGSMGPGGQISGQLYWIREYDKHGQEIMQYAQTRPFLDYLRDHPGAITAWIGGHTHVDFPEQMLDYRGIRVRKYGVTFLSVGALTQSHGEGENQMSRLLTFENGEDEAVLNVYIHRSVTGIHKGWYASAVRKIPLGRNFECPARSTCQAPPVNPQSMSSVPDAPAELFAPRYAWHMDADKVYDFNNATHVIGEDGSPYGRYEGIRQVVYSNDTHGEKGRSLDLRGTDGRVVFDAPYQPEMNWKRLTISLWMKTSSVESQEIISYSSQNGVGKFRLWYDGSDLIWDVAEGNAWRSARWESAAINLGGEWHQLTAIADGGNDVIQLWVDARLVAYQSWGGESLNAANGHRFVVGASGDPTQGDDPGTWSRSFDGLIDEVRVFDAVIYPAGW
jgi:hypothetical protein